VSFVEFFIEEEGKQQAAATGGGGEGMGRTGAVESVGVSVFKKKNHYGVFDQSKLHLTSSQPSWLRTRTST